MPNIAPFRAIRYADHVPLDRVLAPPYDLISEGRRRELEDLHPHNFVRINMGESSGEVLRAWVAEGVLVEDPDEAIYLYCLEYAGPAETKRTFGVLGALQLEELGDSVHPHEATMPGPKANRLRSMEMTGANLEALWLVAARPVPGIERMVSAAEAADPIISVVDSFGTRHMIWGLDAGEWTPSLESIPLVIADGHHRYETALRYRDAMRQLHGPGPWDRTLAFVSDPQTYPPQILPIHRLVPSVDHSALRALVPLAPVAETLTELASGLLTGRPGTIGFASPDGRWTLESKSPVDAEFLHKALAEPLGLEPRYEHDLEVVRESVDAGESAFLLAPVPLGIVTELALSGRRMPPKTTLFWPKPASGLVLRDIRGSGR